MAIGKVKRTRRKRWTPTRRPAGSGPFDEVGEAMPEPWHRPLAEIRERFADHIDDLRHILLSIDAEVIEVPPDWEARDPADGFAWWGLPPDQRWRRLPGEDRARPVVCQEFEHGSPFEWKHTFYG